MRRLTHHVVMLTLALLGVGLLYIVGPPYAAVGVVLFVIMPGPASASNL